MRATLRATPGMRVRRSTPRGALHRRRLTEFLLFILPWIIGFIAFEAYPLLQSLQISVSTLNFSAHGVSWTWVGLKNFQNALTVDTSFVPYMVQAIISTVVELPLILVFSLTGAVMMKQGLWGTTFFRGLFFLPVVIGSSAVMSRLLGAGGVPVIIQGRFMAPIYHTVGPTIGNDIAQVFQDMSLVLWRSGVQVLLFLAGLFGISPTYYEVARIDGANAWQTFLKVTLPCLSPMVLLVTVFTLVDSFTNPLLNPVLTYIESQGLGGNLNLGLAGAMGWMYLIVVFIILAIILKYAQQHVYYAGER